MSTHDGSNRSSLPKSAHGLLARRAWSRLVEARLFDGQIAAWGTARPPRRRVGARSCGPCVRRRTAPTTLGQTSAVASSSPRPEMPARPFRGANCPGASGARCSAPTTGAQAYAPLSKGVGLREWRARSVGPRRQARHRRRIRDFDDRPVRQTTNLRTPDAGLAPILVLRRPT